MKRYAKRFFVAAGVVLAALLAVRKMDEAGAKITLHPGRVASSKSAGVNTSGPLYLGGGWNDQSVILWRGGEFVSGGLRTGGSRVCVRRSVGAVTGLVTLQALDWDQCPLSMRRASNGLEGGLP